MNRPNRTPILLVMAALAAIAFPLSIHAQQVIAFTGCTVWDGTGTPPKEVDILVVDGRITEIGDPSIPRNATRVDLQGRWIIPGLVETHAHVSGYWAPDGVTDAADRIAADLALYARYGVTTVNSLGGEPPEALGLRTIQDTPAQDRARLAFAGPVITATTPAAGRSAVRDNAEADVDWIKIRVDDNLGTTDKMPWETVEAILTATHDRGLRLATHLFYLDDAKRLLRMGTDMVAHSIRDAEVDAEVVDLLLETGTCYVPTLTREVSTFAYAERPDFFDDPFFQADAKPSEVARVSTADFMARMAENPASARYEEALVQAQSNLKLLWDAGVRVAFGTDAGPPARFPGYFEHMELQLMVDAGLTPTQALRTATGLAAGCLDMPDVGTLEPGKWADFLVLGRNPIEDISATKDLQAVYIAGNPAR
jgi:imidazolonepropionase-like amidohydrolase